jgi:hypothetical protein
MTVVILDLAGQAIQLDHEDRLVLIICHLMSSGLQEHHRLPAAALLDTLFDAVHAFAATEEHHKIIRLQLERLVVE